MNPIKLFSHLLLLIFLCSSHHSHAYSDEYSSRVNFFQAYKPIYFIVGNNAKVSLSFKSQIIGDTPIYFAYNQLMIWQIFKDVPYFSDINYNPELFYRFKLNPTLDQSLDFVFLTHESNGEGGSKEKSWNRSGLKLQWTTIFHEDAKIYWSLNLWYPYYYNKFNPDIVIFRGLAELTVTITQFIGKQWDQDDFTIRFFLGGSSYLNPLQGGQEFTLRVKAKNRTFLPLFIAQVYHGYGQTLNTYRENSLALRVGIGF